MTDRIISLDAAIRVVQDNLAFSVKADIIKALSALPAVGGWNKTTNAIPEDGQVVIVWNKSRIQPESAYRCMSGGRYCWFLDDVRAPIKWEPSHWRPLPAPPEIE